MATKITYATLGGEQLDDLHRELDEAIARRPGRRSAASTFSTSTASRSAPPSSSTIAAPSTPASCSGTFQQGTREHVRDGRRRRARRVSGLERRCRGSERVALRPEGRRRHSRAPLGAVGADGLRGRQEPPRMRRRRRGVGRSDRVLLRSDRAARRLRRAKMGTLGPGEENLSVLRPYGVWAVISPFNFPLALAAGPAGGALRRRQHRRLQAGERHAAARARSSYEMTVEAGLAAGRLQLRHRAGRHGRPGADRQRRHRRHRLHRIEGSRDEADARQRGARRCRGRSSSRWAARTRRSSWRRPISTRRATASCGRRSARRARSARPARASTSQKDVRDEFVRAARREDEEDQDRQPARARRLDGPGHQRGGGQDVSSAPSSGRRRDGGKILIGGRRITDGAVRPRLLRRADDHRRPADRVTRCFPKSCSCRSRVVADVHDARRGASSWPTAPSTG